MPSSRIRILAEHPDAAGGDRAHRQLGMPGHADLADQKDVELGPQGSRDLGGDGHAAARQSKDEDVGPARVRREPGGELAAGVDAIVKTHGRSDSVQRVCLGGLRVPRCLVPMFGA